RVAELVGDLQGIREAVSAAANEDAQQKVAAAGEAIDRYFRSLAANPAVSGIKLTVTSDSRSGRNSYAITDQEGRDLTPVLSQGDLNALALAIFLGLAAAGTQTGNFGFILMDDPSQSLDAEHKKQLVQVLNDIAGRKTLVLATMDREFHEALRAGLTKGK